MAAAAVAQVFREPEAALWVPDAQLAAAVDTHFATVEVALVRNLVATVAVVYEREYFAAERAASAHVGGLEPAAALAVDLWAPGTLTAPATAVLEAAEATVAPLKRVVLSNWRACDTTPPSPTQKR